jgi:NADH-quinone oxidoreductase subunit N
VWIGAVAILILFVIMLLNVKSLTSSVKLIKHLTQKGGIVVGAFFAVWLREYLVNAVDFHSVSDFVANIVEYVSIYFGSSVYLQVTYLAPDVNAIALLYTQHASLFWITTINLLIALLGAIILATSTTEFPAMLGHFTSPRHKEWLYSSTNFLTARSYQAAPSVSLAAGLSAGTRAAVQALNSAKTISAPITTSARYSATGFQAENTLHIGYGAPSMNKIEPNSRSTAQQSNSSNLKKMVNMLAAADKFFNSCMRWRLGRLTYGEAIFFYFASCLWVIICLLCYKEAPPAVAVLQEETIVVVSTLADGLTNAKIMAVQHTTQVHYSQPPTLYWGVSARQWWYVLWYELFMLGTVYIFAVSGSLSVPVICWRTIGYWKNFLALYGVVHITAGFVGQTFSYLSRVVFGQATEAVRCTSADWFLGDWGSFLALGLFLIGGGYKMRLCWACSQPVFRLILVRYVKTWTALYAVFHIVTRLVRAVTSYFSSSSTSVSEQAMELELQLPGAVAQDPKSAAAAAAAFIFFCIERRYSPCRRATIKMKTYFNPWKRFAIFLKETWNLINPHRLVDVARVDNRLTPLALLTLSCLTGGGGAFFIFPLSLVALKQDRWRQKRRLRAVSGRKTQPLLNTGMPSWRPRYWVKIGARYRKHVGNVSWITHKIRIYRALPRFLKRLFPGRFRGLRAVFCATILPWLHYTALQLYRYIPYLVLIMFLLPILTLPTPWPFEEVNIMFKDLCSLYKTTHYQLFSDPTQGPLHEPERTWKRMFITLPALYPAALGNLVFAITPFCGGLRVSRFWLFFFVACTSIYLGHLFSSAGRQGVPILLKRFFCKVDRPVHKANRADFVLWGIFRSRVYHYYTVIPHPDKGRSDSIYWILLTILLLALKIAFHYGYFPNIDPAILTADGIHSTIVGALLPWVYEMPFRGRFFCTFLIICGLVYGLSGIILYCTFYYLYPTLPRPGFPWLALACLSTFISIACIWYEIFPTTPRLEFLSTLFAHPKHYWDAPFLMCIWPLFLTSYYLVFGADRIFRRHFGDMASALYYGRRFRRRLTNAAIYFKTRRFWDADLERRFRTIPTWQQTLIRYLPLHLQDPNDFRRHIDRGQKMRRNPLLLLLSSFTFPSFDWFLMYSSSPTPLNDLLGLLHASSNFTAFVGEWTLGVVTVVLLIGTSRRMSERRNMRLIALVNWRAACTGVILVCFLYVLQIVFALVHVSSHSAYAGYFYVATGLTVSKLLVALTALLVLVSSGNYIREHRHHLMEFPVVIIVALLQLLLMLSSNNLMAIFFTVAGLSLALYVLVLFHGGPSLGARAAALKYFYLSAVSAGLLLFGSFLVLTITKSTDYFEIAALLSKTSGLSLFMPEDRLILIAGLVFIIFGFLFKLSAFPGHLWAVEIYEGSPAPVVAFFVLPVKIAFFVTFVRLLQVAFQDLSSVWQPLISLAGVGSLLIGAFATVGSFKVMRFLGYASINQIGYLLLGLSLNSAEATKATYAYLIAYAIMSSGFLFILLHTRRRDTRPLTFLQDLRDLHTASPTLAWHFAVFLLSMAGIPPLLGFITKFYLFVSGVPSTFYTPTTVALSLLSAYYYIRLFKIYWFEARYKNRGKNSIYSCVSARGWYLLSGLEAMLWLCPLWLPVIDSTLSSVTLPLTTMCLLFITRGGNKSSRGKNGGRFLN